MINRVRKNLVPSEIRLPCYDDEAFTLIELIVVIFIISLFAAMVMPSLWDTGERALKAESRKMSNTLRYLYDEAVSKKQTYELIFDLENDAWSFKSKSESRRFKMKDNVVFKDIVVPSLGEVSFGELKMLFGPLGPEEPVIVHLMKGDEDYTVVFNNLNGRAKIYEGYRI